MTLQLPWLDDLMWRGGLSLFACILCIFLWVEHGKYEDMRDVAMQATSGFALCKTEVGDALDATEARMLRFEQVLVDAISLSVIEP